MKTKLERKLSLLNNLIIADMELKSNTLYDQLSFINCFNYQNEIKQKKIGYLQKIFKDFNTNNLFLVSCKNKVGHFNNVEKYYGLTKYLFKSYNLRVNAISETLCEGKDTDIFLALFGELSSSMIEYYLLNNNVFLIYCESNIKKIYEELVSNVQSNINKAQRYFDFKLEILLTLLKKFDLIVIENINEGDNEFLNFYYNKHSKLFINR